MALSRPGITNPASRSRNVTAQQLLISTAPSREEATGLARELLSRRLAACVNVVGPIQSIYRWKGEVEEAQEFLLLIKTTAERAAAVREAIVELHSYDVPELIQLSIESGLPEYLRWIGDSVKE
jgi:periplasmic divalent cation tolerance protein